MRVLLIACKTIEDEVNEAVTRLGLDYQIVWLEGGLHNSVERLHDRLSEVMAAAEGQCDHLVFTLGYCGGGVNDLATGNYTTILPLADDCITVLLGSLGERMRTSRPPTYYLTSGWMRHENNVVADYERMIEKYGHEKAIRINKMMLKHYSRFGLVDTGTYDLSQAAAKVEPLSEIIGLRIENLDGNKSWLDCLLTGPWDDLNKFIVLPPNSELNFDTWQALLDQVEPSIQS